MADQVWLVTSGSYSDYSVDRVFSSEENAKRWIGECTDHFHVEPRPLDDFEHSPKEGMSGWMDLADSGKHSLCKMLFKEDVDGVHIWIGLLGQPRPCLFMNFDHTDRERAVKVMSEKRAALVASGDVWIRDRYSRDLTLISRDYVHGHKVLV